MRNFKHTRALVNRNLNFMLEHFMLKITFIQNLFIEQNIQINLNFNRPHRIGNNFFLVENGPVQNIFIR